jgi:AcrR family transcriptional regulator
MSAFFGEEVDAIPDERSQGASRWLFATVRCNRYTTMELKELAVKSTPRRYDASGRRAQAARSRAAVVDAARDLFLSTGYAATTIASIGIRAAVSVETIYKVFGGKPGLVRALCDQALAGAGPIPAEHRSDELQNTEPDPRAIIRGWGALTVEVAPRIVPILLLVRDAAINDPAMAELQAEMDQSRLSRMTHNAARLAKPGQLRAGLDVTGAADVLWTYSSPELFELLVLHRGWAVQRYATFIADAMIAALLADGDPDLTKLDSDRSPLQSP